MERVNVGDILLDVWHNKRPNWAVLGLSLAGLAPLSLAAYSWISSVGYVVQALYGIATGFAIVALFHFHSLRRSKHRRRRAAFVAAMSELSRKDLEKLFPRGCHQSLSFSDMGTEHWLNRNLRVVWPHLSQAASTIIKDTLQGALNEYRIDFIKSIEVTTVSLGTVAPDLRGVRVGGHDPSTPGHDIVVEADLDWRRPRGELLELKIAPELGPKLTVQVKKLQFHCLLKLVFKPLVEEFPCIGAMLFSMSEEPMVNYKISLLGVPDVTSLPAFDKMIDDSIKSAIMDLLVWPARVVIPFMNGDFSYLALQPIGTVSIVLIEAKDLIQLDVIGKSDPFVVMYVHKKQGQVKRSSSKKHTQKPYWNEGFDLVVEDPNSQVVNFLVMDAEKFGKADFQGAAIFPLSELRPFRQKDVWLELYADAKDPKKGQRGKLHVCMMYKPFKEQESSASSLSDADSVEIPSQTDAESVNDDIGSPGPVSGELLHDVASRSSSINGTEGSNHGSHHREALLAPEGLPPPPLPSASKVRGTQSRAPLESVNGVKSHYVNSPGRSAIDTDHGALDAKRQMIRRRMASTPNSPLTNEDRFDLHSNWSEDLGLTRHKRPIGSPPLGGTSSGSFTGITPSRSSSSVLPTSGSFSGSTLPRKL